MTVLPTNMPMETVTVIERCRTAPTSVEVANGPAPLPNHSNKITKRCRECGHEAGLGSERARSISPLLDTEAVAMILGVPEQTLRQWRCAGLGPDFIKLGVGPKAAVRYTLKDVEDYIAHHRHTNAMRAFVTEDLDDRL